MCIAFQSEDDDTFILFLILQTYYISVKDLIFSRNQEVTRPSGFQSFSVHERQRIQMKVKGATEQESPEISVPP